MDRVPGNDADGFEWLNYVQAGVLTSAQATELVGRSAVRSHLRQRRWRTVCRGVLSTQNGPLGRRQQLWTAVLVAGPGACLAGPTAAAENGVTGLRAEPVHVLVPAHRNRSALVPALPPDMAAVQVHRTAVLPDGHLRLCSPPRTTTARSVIDAAAWAAGDREALATVVSACQQGRVRPAELRAVLAMFPRVRRRRLIRATIADVEGGAGALSEIDFVALCRRHRLPSPSLQLRRADAYGRVRHVDAHWPEHHVLVEVDGGHHMEVRQWAADMLRQNEIWIGGDRILRFPAWLIRTDPALVVAQLRAALTAAPIRARSRPAA